MAESGRLGKRRRKEFKHIYYLNISSHHIGWSGGSINKNVLSRLERLVITMVTPTVEQLSVAVSYLK